MAPLGCVISGLRAAMPGMLWFPTPKHHPGAPSSQAPLLPPLHTRPHPSFPQPHLANCGSPHSSDGAAATLTPARSLIHWQRHSKSTKPCCHHLGATSSQPLRDVQSSGRNGSSRAPKRMQIPPRSPPPVSIIILPPPLQVHCRRVRSSGVI